MLIDSPYLPGRARRAARPARRRGLRAGRPARHPRRLRPPARPAGLPGHDARARGELGRAPAPRAGRGPARAARLRRRVLRRPPGAARRSARCRRCRCRATWRSASRELELHPAEGHTTDGMALFDRGAGPADAWATTCPTWRSPGSRGRLARPTTARRSRVWRRWWRQAETVVPGHGAPHDRDTALRLLDEDVDYLDALERGEDALPKGRDTQGPARDPRGERGGPLGACGLDRLLPGAEAAHPHDLVAGEVEQVGDLLVELDLTRAAAHVHAAQARAPMSPRSRISCSSNSQMSQVSQMLVEAARHLVDAVVDGAARPRPGWPAPTRRSRRR